MARAKFLEMASKAMEMVSKAKVVERASKAKVVGAEAFRRMAAKFAPSSPPYPPELIEKGRTSVAAHRVGKMVSSSTFKPFDPYAAAYAIEAEVSEFRQNASRSFITSPHAKVLLAVLLACGFSLYTAYVDAAVLDKRITAAEREVYSKRAN